MRSLIERLHRERTLSPDEFRVLLSQCEEEDLSFINTLAREVAQQNFGNKIFIRGLIEVGNRCKNDCYYCGIRRSNHQVERYHLDEETVLACCRHGYELGFRTFVLQGGEINDDEMIVRTVTSIRKEFPDVAITLSLGEKKRRCMNVSFRQEPTVTCFVTKRTINRITASYILKTCHCPIA